MAGETRIDVPRAASFALRGAHPNPSRGVVDVAFSLPRETPAQLTVVDIGGRVRSARELGGLGAGNHVIRLGDFQALESGMYWVVLTQDGRSVSSRLVVTH